MSLDAFLRKYGTETELDTLSQFDQFMINQDIKKQQEEEERLRLEEENRIKEAERKAAEVEAAKLNMEEMSWEDIRDVVSMKENAAQDPNAVNDKNNDGSKDFGMVQINERWINKGLTSSGLPSFELNNDPKSQYFGQPDSVYPKVQEYMSEQIPNWNMMSDEYKRQAMFDPEINYGVGEILYNNRGLDPWSTRAEIKEELQTKIRSEIVDSLVNNSMLGSAPKLEDIVSRINLDSSAVSESTLTAPEDIEATLVRSRREEAFGEDLPEYGPRDVVTGVAQEESFTPGPTPTVSEAEAATEKEPDLLNRLFLMSLMENMQGEDIGQAPAVVAGGGRREFPTMMRQFAPWEREKPYWWLR